MKYIKSFNKNESHSYYKAISVKRKISQFCDDYLAFLKDEGFIIKVEHMGDDSHFNKGDFSIKILRNDSYGVAKSYEWSEVKDELIPFYELLKENFDVQGAKIKIGNVDLEYLIENDDLITTNNISYDVLFVLIIIKEEI